MHLVTPASLLPFTSPSSNLAAQTQDVCLCGDFCNCNVGVPVGEELIALAKRVLISDQIEMATLSAKSKTKRLADLETRTRRSRLLILHEEFRVAVRTEMASF